MISLIFVVIVICMFLLRYTHLKEDDIVDACALFCGNCNNKPSLHSCY